MSFWKDVGDFLDDAGSTTTDAFSTAFTFAGDDVLKPVGQALAATGRTSVHGLHNALDTASYAVDNPVVRPVLGAVNAAWHAGFDHPVAAYGNLISDPNELGVFNAFDPSKVEDAWNRSLQEDLRAGQSFSGTLAGVSMAATPEAQQERDQYYNSWAGKLSSGAADLAAGWYADPGVIGGKALKVSRDLKTGIKSNEERSKVLDYAQGRTNAAQAGKRAQKLGDRFNQMIESTDGLSASQIAQVPALKTSADAGALSYLFERANMEHAGDLDTLHAAKRDIFAAALGDDKAIGKLKAQRSELAAEMQQLATTPTPTKFDEAFTWDDNGQGALGIFNPATPDPMDQRLMDQIDGKISMLDRAVGAAGSTSKIASVGTEKAFADVQQGYLYSGMAGRPVRAVANSFAKRLPGYVSLKDPVTGFGQLQQALKAMVHTTPEVRTDLLDRYTRATDAGERRQIVAETESRMVHDTADHYGITAQAAGTLLQAAQGRRGAYLKTLAGRLYSATDADKWISMVDPEADEVLALSKPLAKSQIEDHHPIMDPTVVDKFLKQQTNQRAVELFGQRFGEKTGGLATKMADATGTGIHWTDSILRGFSSKWKDSALFRLAYPARVQVDTQMRMLTQMGALQYMSALKNGAVKGQFKYLLQGDVGDGRLRSLFRAPEDLSAALKDTLMRGGEYRGLSTDPVTDEAHLKEIAGRLFKNDGSMADLISEVADTDLRKVRQSGDWGIVQPDNEGWATAYSRAVNRQVRNSPTMMQALVEPDNQALKRWVLSTPEGQAEWREMKPGWKQIDPWLQKVREHVDHYLPNQEVRDVVTERPLGADDISQFFGGKASANRMRVHGESFSPNSTGMRRVNERYNELREGYFRWAGEAPETILGRSPMYAHFFEQHMKEQIDRLAHGNIDEMALRKNADRMARRDVGQILFDTSDASNMATHFRLISPFFAAWEDTMKKWGRLIYQDPSRASRLVQVWHAPNNFGLVVDSQSNQVDAEGRTFDAQGKQITDKNYRGNGNYIVLPLPHWLGKRVGAGAVRINKDSANVVFQGEPWWLPGAGPLVQVPVNEIVKKSFPEYAEDPILHYVLPFGVSDQPAADQFIPAWVRQARNAFGGTTEYATIYKTLLAQEYAKKNLGQIKDVNQDAVAKKTRNWFIMKAVTGNASPVSVAPTPEFQFYIDQAHDYQRKYGRDWEDKFYKDFPDYFEMAIQMTSNNTGIMASASAYDATKRYSRLIAQHPDYGWMFVGPANDPAQPFNQGVYAWQKDTPISANSTTTFRSATDPAKALGDVESQKGWIEYQQGAETIRQALAARGLHSVNQAGAEDLAAAKTKFVEKLGAENPSWLEDYQAQGPNKVQQLLRAAQDGIKRDKSLADRPDFQALGDYLKGRQWMQQQLAARGSKTLASNTDLQFAWDQFTAELVASNFSFSQMWDRVLQHDDLKGDLSLGSGTQ